MGKHPESLLFTMSHNKMHFEDILETSRNLTYIKPPRTLRKQVLGLFCRDQSSPSNQVVQTREELVNVVL